MKHLEAGLLHAYLDGETPAAVATDVERHVQDCTQCARAFEAAIAERSTASHVVGLAVGAEISPPAWEALVDRATDAAEGNAFPPTRRPRGSVLAWAATIAVAFTLGWQASQVWREPATDSPEFAASAPDRSAAPEAEETRGSAGRRNDEVADLSQAQAPTGTAPDDETVARQKAINVVEPAVAVPDATRAVLAESAEAAVPVTPAGETLEPPARAPEPPASLAETGRMRTVEQSADSDALPVPRRQEEADYAYDEAAVTDMRELGAVPRFYDFDAFEEPAHEVSTAEAAELLGTELLSLPDADRLRIATGLPAVVPGGRGAVVGQLFTTQRGDLVWVIEQTVSQADPATDLGDVIEAEGYRVLRLRVPGRMSVVEIRAELPEAELRRLAAELR